MSATTTTTTLASSGKMSEFARLFDFFSRLASGDRDIFVPREFESLVDILPVSPTSSMASLPGLCRSPDSTTTSISDDLPTLEDDFDELEMTENNVHKRRLEEKEDVRKFPVPRGRRNSIAVVRDRNTAARLARRFPLADGSKHEFTFKMMIHELYDIGDFAAMVQDVILASREQFRPLPAELKTPNKKRRESLGGGFFSGKEVQDEEDETREKIERFPKGLGLGRPSGLDIPAAERALKKRRVGRRRSVSGGPMEKEPDWIDSIASLSICDPIDEVPRTPVSANTRGNTRTRKPSASRNTQKRVPLTPPAREAPVVREAERFLNLPVLKYSPGSGRRRVVAGPIERTRSEELEFGEMPMSAPCTQDRFNTSKGEDEVKTMTIGAKRRLSFSA